MISFNQNTMENTPQNKKTLEREIRELTASINEKKVLSGIKVLEDELKFKQEQFRNLPNS